MNRITAKPVFRSARYPTNRQSHNPSIEKKIQTLYMRKIYIKTTGSIENHDIFAHFFQNLAWGRAHIFKENII